MPIQNVDLFKGLAVVSEISAISVVDKLAEGSVVYAHKDPANYFYILIDGKIDLSECEESKAHYMVTREGEIFGWSSMADREFYTTTATCITPVTLVRISKKRLNQIFERHPFDGMLFYKRLSAAILQRLVDTSRAVSSKKDL